MWLVVAIAGAVGGGIDVVGFGWWELPKHPMMFLKFFEIDSDSVGNQSGHF